MKQYLIDTNVLISFVTDRNPAQQESVARLFEQAAQARVTVLCPQNVLVEFAYVMDKVYRQSKPLVRQLLIDFIALPGVTVVNDVDFAEVLDLSRFRIWATRWWRQRRVGRRGSRWLPSTRISSGRSRG